MEKIIIAAISKNNVIGLNGKVPWHIPEELIHFKNTTLGFPVIIGRKTWDSLKKPLENRLNIILTHKTDFSFSHPNVVICNAISEALSFCTAKDFQKIFIIGGQEVFEQMIPISDKLIISEIQTEVEGDRFFPSIDYSDWELVNILDKKEFIVKEYLRKKEN